VRHERSVFDKATVRFGVRNKPQSRLATQAWCEDVPFVWRRRFATLVEVPKDDHR
jgi:hypothetical protein